MNEYNEMAHTHIQCHVVVVHGVGRRASISCRVQRLGTWIFIYRADRDTNPASLDSMKYAQTRRRDRTRSVEGHELEYHERRQRRAPEIHCGYQRVQHKGLVTGMRIMPSRPRAKMMDA